MKSNLLFGAITKATRLPLVAPSVAAQPRLRRFTTTPPLFTLLLLFGCLSLWEFRSAAQSPAGRVVTWNQVGGGWPDVRPGVILTNISCGRLGITSEGRVVKWPSDAIVPTGLSNVVATAGSFLALRSDGRVVAWGPWTNQVTGLSGVKAIAASGTHGLALHSNGTVVAWGDNWAGQASVPAGLTGVVGITAGNAHGVALKSNGTVVAWGWEGATNAPAGLSGVARVIAGGDSTLAILSNGTVVAWGATEAITRVPPDLADVVTAGCGTRAAVAVRSNGSVVAWGTGVSSGSFGDRGLTNVPPGLTNVVEVSVNHESAMARRRDGTFIGWGWNFSYETTLPPFHTGIVSLGGSSSMRDGSKFFLNRAGRLEDNGSVYRPPPPDLTNVVDFARGGSSEGFVIEHFLALRPDGTVVAWGDNQAGQTNVPVGLSNVVAVSAGANHSVALRADGRVVAWGSNLAVTNLPPSLSGVKAIAAGKSFTIALRSNGTMVAWGQVIVSPPALTDVVAVSAVNSYGMALRSNGRVAAWGRNPNVPAGLSNVVAVAAGTFHNVALLSNGTVVAWGDGGIDQPYPVPAGLKNVIAIATAGLSTYALVLDPQLSIRRNGSNVVLGFRSFRGRAYRIEYSTDLAPNNWFNLTGGNVTGTGADVEVTDNDISPGQPARFYRLVELD